MTAPYWQQINPHLSIGADRRAEECRFEETWLSEQSGHLNGRGYLHTQPLLTAAETGSLRDGILNLSERGLPPVYIYIYDQPWMLFARLRRLVSRFLGDDFRLLPNFWAWHIRTTPGAAGWPPHQDCQAQTRFADGLGGHTLMSLSLWIPLTDADEDNGCMHVLPRERELAHDPPLTDPDDLNPAEGVALPAKAGSVLGWPQDLYHWSGRASGRSATPRISLSLEFQNPAFEPLRAPLLDIDRPPDLETRLSLIADQFPRYHHMERLEFDPASLDRIIRQQ